MMFCEEILVKANPILTYSSQHFKVVWDQQQFENRACQGFTWLIINRALMIFNMGTLVLEGIPIGCKLKGIEELSVNCMFPCILLSSRHYNPSVLGASYQACVENTKK